MATATKYIEKKQQQQTYGYDDAYATGVGAVMDLMDDFEGGAHHDLESKMMMEQ